MDTETLKFGKKSYIIKSDIPLKILDDFVRDQKRLKGMSEDERELESIPLRNKVLKALVVQPKIDDKYLDEEGTLDDFECGLRLIEMVGRMVEERFKKEKKTVTS